MNKKIDEYQNYANKIHILNAEIDRLRDENTKYDEEIRRMRSKYADNISWERSQ